MSFFTEYTRATVQLSFVRQWGESGSPAPPIALQVAVAPSGNIYIVDSNNHQVHIYENDGDYIDSFGSQGGGDGEFQYPWGIAIGPDGSPNSEVVYVVDSNNHRVQYFKPGGSYLGEFGGPGTGPDKFRYPRGIAINSFGAIYVVDSGNHRVMRYNHQHLFAGPIGSEGSNQGELLSPEDIAVGQNFRIYVTNTGNHRVEVYDDVGHFVANFGGQGTGSGKFNFPKGISIDADFEVRVADTGNGRIQGFTPNGSFLFATGTQGSGDGEFNGAQDLAIGPNNQIYVADSGNRRVQVFSDDGDYLSQFEYNEAGTAASNFDTPLGLAIGPHNNHIYVTDYENHRVQIFGLSGNFLSQFGIYGPGQGEFKHPLDVTVSQAGNVYVSDEHDRIQKFTDTGNYLATFGNSGNGDGQISTPSGITASIDNYFYVADTKNDRILIFGLNGNYINTFGSSGAGNGQFQDPHDVAVSLSDEVFVVDTDNHRIQVFSRFGTFLRKWGEFGTDDGQFNSPKSIAIGPDSTVYITDSGNNRVQAFDTDGNFLAKIGVFGANPSQFSTPRGIDVSKDNHFYVADSYNNRIQEFAVSQTTTGTNSNGGASSSGSGSSGQSGGAGGYSGVSGSGSGGNSNPIIQSAENSGGEPIGQNSTSGSQPDERRTGGDSSGFGQSIRENISSVSTSVREAFVAPTQSAIVKITEIMPRPFKTYIPRSIMTSGLLVGSIAMITDNFFATPITLKQLLLLPARLWANLLTMLGIRKRRRPWGTVYDSTTKQPVDPIYLELVNTEGRVVAKTMTDVYGRYSFNVTPGHYMLRPVKEGYVFPSLILAHMTHDEIFGDLYFGNYFEIKQEGELISKNIPLDRQNVNWREFTKHDQNLLKWYVKRDVFISRLTNTLFFLGFVVAGLAILFTPQVYTVLIFLLYLFMFTLKRFGHNPSKLGKVVDKNSKEPVAYAIVRVFSVALGNEVVRKVTNQYGQFFCPVPDGAYYVSFDKKNDNGTYTEATEKPLVETRRGVIAGKWDVSY